MTAWLLLVAGYLSISPFVTAIGFAGIDGTLPATIAPLAPELAGVTILTASLFVEHLVGVRYALRSDSADAGVAPAGAKSISFQRE